MNTDEAIKILRQLRYQEAHRVILDALQYTEEHDNNLEALDMAIEVLKAQDATGYTISRQAAIDAVHKDYDKILDFKSDGKTIASSVEDIVCDLPSAQPKKGYTKADYIMALHKEYGCDIRSAEKAHDMALEYLRSLSKMKG